MITFDQARRNAATISRADSRPIWINVGPRRARHGVAELSGQCGRRLSRAGRRSSAAQIKQR